MLADTTANLRDLANQHLWMHNRDWVQMGQDAEPLIMAEGHGIRVTDTDGKTWIDVNGGYTSVNVGYGRSEIAEAAYDQMLSAAYVPQRSTARTTIELVEKLAEITPGTLSRTFPTSGGSEAIETALLIARAYHRRRGEHGRYRVISRKGSFHGGLGGVQWLGSSLGSARGDYEPEYPGMVYAPQPNPYRCELGGDTPSECAIRCAKALDDLIVFHEPSTVAAVIAEPIARPPGAAVPGDEYWPMLRETCDKHGVLLIADEVTTGFGRTGKMFGLDHWDVAPDIMTTGGGISSAYLPMGGVTATKEVADLFGGEDNYLRHVFTFAGHPVASAAALKSIEIIEGEGLVENAAEVGGYFREQLEGLMIDHPIIGDVRGLGLMLALDLVSDRRTKDGFAPDQNVPGRLTEKFRNHGLLLRVSDEIVHIGPPLSITRDEVDEIVHAIDLSLWELEGDLGTAIMA